MFSTFSMANQNNQKGNKMKFNNEEQAAINAIAKNAYIADLFGKYKGDIVKKSKAMIDEHEAEFRVGVPAEFEYEGLVIKCKLTMTPSPKWSDKEVVVFQSEKGKSKSEKVK